MTPQPVSASSTEKMSAGQKKRPASGGQPRPAKRVSLAGGRSQENSRRREELVSPQPFADAPSCACYTAELCAGSAGLSAKLYEKGFTVVPVDHSHNSHRQQAPCVILDLSIDSGWVLLYRLLSEKRLFYVHGAPPCGTSSKAREIPLPQNLKRKGVREPQPLRSNAEPHGLQGLRQEDQARVEKANAIYSRMAAFFTACDAGAVLWSCENPTTSYLWRTLWFVTLAALNGVVEAIFDQCMHGGKRRVSRKWLTNCTDLLELSGKCDKSHEHLPFGGKFTAGAFGFATSEEAEYPAELCKKVASLVAARAERDGVHLCPPRPAVREVKPQTQPSKVAALRANASRQARGRRYPEMMPEYKSTFSRIVQAAVVARFNLQKKATVTDSASKALAVPGHAIILDIHVKEGSDVADVSFGVYHSHQEFLEEAFKLSHPFDGTASLQDDLLEVVFEHLTEGMEFIGQKRELVFAHYEARRAALEVEELRIHEQMRPEREKIMREKRFLLFFEMCEDAGIKDTQLRQDYISGGALVGKAYESPLFEAKHADATMSVERVTKSANWL